VGNQFNTKDGKTIINLKQKLNSLGFPMTNEFYCLQMGGRGYERNYIIITNIILFQLQQIYICHSYTCHYILILVICFIYLFSLYVFTFNVGNGGLLFIRNFYENITLDHHLLQSMMMMMMDNNHVVVVI